LELMTIETLTVTAFLVLLMNVIVLLAFMTYHYKTVSRLEEEVRYWRQEWSCAAKANHIASRQQQSDPVGGDNAFIECPECKSQNTEFEEYSTQVSSSSYWIARNNPPEAISELGIRCRECEHRVEPNDLINIKVEEL
jgi:ribosomal protein S27E